MSTFRLQKALHVRRIGLVGPLCRQEHATTWASYWGEPHTCQKCLAVIRKSGGVRVRLRGMRVDSR